MFVCLGNICRSPLAEAIFKQMIDQQGIKDKIIVDSSGTSNYHIGMPPDRRTISNAQSNGVTVDHRAKQFCMDDFIKYDYILVMDDNNWQHVLSMHNEMSNSTCLIAKLRQYDKVGINLDVPDPYYGGPDGFQEVLEILNRSCEGFLHYLINKHSIN